MVERNARHPAAVKNHGDCVNQVSFQLDLKQGFLYQNRVLLYHGYDVYHGPNQE